MGGHNVCDFIKAYIVEKGSRGRVGLTDLKPPPSPRARKISLKWKGPLGTHIKYQNVWVRVWGRVVVGGG